MQQFQNSTTAAWAAGPATAGVPEYTQALSSEPTTPKETYFGSSIFMKNASMFGSTGEDDVRRHEEEQKGYGEKRDSLVVGLDAAGLLLKSLQSFNQEKWTIHYPHQLGLSASSSIRPSVRSTNSTPVDHAKRTLRRSSSMFLDESNATASNTHTNDESSSTHRPSPSQRSYSTAETPVKARSETSSTSAAPPHPLSILSLDLKLGHSNSHPTSSLPALLPSLSISTLSQLLSRRLTTSLSHLQSLHARVIDTSSRILVTGDLNSGKSTLVNALLRRQVMTADQQPCTTIFCEVLDAAAYNDGKEELHAIKDMGSYQASNPATYDLFPLQQIDEVQDTGDVYQIIKTYVNDSRAPKDEQAPNPSFIKNGLVSISLIDAPGLNRDTLSTTALFARQSEIDVIVFVVSAENHFTLSAKEFLWNASQEKAYVFVVVNKWGAIKDKARCMRVVGEQIKQLSPATWASRSELVHWVDAAEVVECMDDQDVVYDNPAFEQLEQSLRSFVLLKRTKSKLAPAKHYLLNLLSDLSTLIEANLTAASVELAEGHQQLALVKPVHERLSAQRDEIEDGVDKLEESVVQVVKSAAWSRLERAINCVAKGQVVVAEPSDRTSIPFEDSALEFAPKSIPPYPGLMGLWDWAVEVKRVLVQSLEAEVRGAEDDARRETVEGVKNVLTGFGRKYLPEEDMKQNERVFLPEVMFAKRRRGVGKLAVRGQSTGLGLGAAGIGSNWTAGDFDVSFFDLFDIERFSALKYPEQEEAMEKTALIGLGLGSMSLMGGRLLSLKSSMHFFSNIMETLGSKEAKKWAGPFIVLLTVGFTAYVIIDLPRAVPRNVGRKLQAALSGSRNELKSSSVSSSPPSSFSQAHADRISRETRKVLRLAGWDLRERFRAALEKSANERKEIEKTVERASTALTWLDEFAVKVDTENVKLEGLTL